MISFSDGISVRSTQMMDTYLVSRVVGAAKRQGLCALLPVYLGESQAMLAAVVSDWCGWDADRIPGSRYGVDVTGQLGRQW